MSPVTPCYVISVIVISVTVRFLFSLCLTLAAEDGDYLFLSSSQDQTINIWRLTVEKNNNLGHVTLLHQCKGHARSVEALDVCSDKSKVRFSVQHYCA